MKLIHIKNLKRECVLVELPDRATDPEYFEINKNKYIRYWLNGKDYLIDIDYHVGLLGHFPSLKEQDFEGEVKYHATLRLYKDYNTNNHNPTNVFTKRTAIESFISAIESEGWYTENPYGKYEVKDTSATELEKEARSYALWQGAQEKVIDLSRCWLFTKI